MTNDGDQLHARQEMDDPPVYRMLFDDGTGPAEVGLIWRALPDIWRWGFDRLLTDRDGRRIKGTTWSYRRGYPPRNPRPDLHRERRCQRDGRSRHRGQTAAARRARILLRTGGDAARGQHRQ